MTWVIAASSILGAGALISDTRVQFVDGTVAGVLQKAYFVGNYIAAGFAGSVRIGFRLVDSLTDALALPEDLGSQQWDLRVAVPQWVSSARRIFNESPAEERRLGSQLLLVGASHAGQAGSPFPRIDIARLTAPQFIPRFSSGFAIRHLGSGDGLTRYRKSLRPLFRLGAPIRQAHVFGLQQWARQLAFSVTISVRKQSQCSTNEHLHVIGVRSGDLVICTNDMTSFAADGPPIAFKMPQVARSWDEFVALPQTAKIGAAGAIC